MSAARPGTTARHCTRSTHHGPSPLAGGVRDIETTVPAVVGGVVHAYVCGFVFELAPLDRSEPAS
jgi:hypothetical protein